MVPYVLSWSGFLERPLGDVTLTLNQHLEREGGGVGVQTALPAEPMGLPPVPIFFSQQRHSIVMVKSGSAHGAARLYGARSRRNMCLSDDEGDFSAKVTQTFLK